MNTSLRAPTLSELERALDEAVSTLVAYRREQPEQSKRARASLPQGFRANSAADLMATDPEVLRAIDIALAPVETGLKHIIKKLGELIYALVGDGGMADVAERVASLDDDNWQRRMSPIDSAWNGIGSWIS